MFSDNYLFYICIYMDRNRHCNVQGHRCSFFRAGNRVDSHMELFFNNYYRDICLIIYKTDKMKATNKFWENFVVECGAPIPKKYRDKPKNHDRYTWISQNGDVYKIADITDLHLINIFMMLTKSLAYHEDLDESMPMFGEPQGEMAQDMYFSQLGELSNQVYFLREQLHHIAFEVHKRGLFINQFEKSKVIEFCKCENEGWAKRDGVIICRNCLKPIKNEYYVDTNS